jgi:hypothetical protein
VVRQWEMVLEGAGATGWGREWKNSRTMAQGKRRRVLHRSNIVPGGERFGVVKE